MKNLLKNFIILTLPSLLILVLLLELTFRFVIPAANKPDLYFDREEALVRFDTSTNTKGLFTVGKFAQQRGEWTVNNFGWNNPHDYQQEKNGKQRVAVIGDSFIESLMVNNTEIYPSRLQDLSSNAWEVNSFGISGAPFSQYLHMSRYVTKTFNPDVLIFNVVHNDFYESLTDYKQNEYFKKLSVSPENQVAEVEPLPYELSWGKKLMKRSAIMRYLYVNLQLRYALKGLFHKPENGGQYNANVSVDEITGKRIEIEQAAEYICRRLRAENPDKKIVLVMDGPRNDIYAGSLSNSNVLFLNQMMAKHAAAHDLDFIDLSYVFQEDFRKNKKMFNSEYDSHWDSYGHQVVADTLYKYLSHLQQAKPIIQAQTN
jgi:hypothetical protein